MAGLGDNFEGGVDREVISGPQRLPEAAKHCDYSLITGRRGHKDVSCMSGVNIFIEHYLI